jgi:glycosyltransferase 2 family protein
MHPKLKKTLQYSFFLALGIALTIWQYNKMTADEKTKFLDAIKSAHYIYLLPVIAMSLISHFSRAIRWRYLIQSLGYKAKLTNTFATVMIGYLVNTLLPRAGEVAKCGLLGKKEKIPSEKLLGTIIVERAIDIACYFLLIIITFILQFSRISGFIEEKYDKALATQKMNPFVKYSIIILAFILLIYLLKWLYKKYKDNKVFAKLNGLMVGVKEGFSSINKLQQKKAFWAHTFLIWAMYLLQIYVGFKAMSFTQHLGIDAACVILTIGTLAMILTPGGMGAFPLGVAEVLLLFNIPIEKGNAFGWVIWGVSTSIILVVGIISTIWFERNKNKESYAV